MMNHLTAEIGAWYEDVSTGAIFEVVAIDDDSNTIEYQHIDGEVGEFDFSAWKQLPLLSAEAPEDWSGPLNDIEPDLMDLGDDFQIL